MFPGRVRAGARDEPVDRALAASLGPDRVAALVRALDELAPGRRRRAPA